MRAVLAISIIVVCLVVVSQLPDTEPVVCWTEHGLAFGFKTTLIICVILVFLMGGMKRISWQRAWAEVALAAIVLLILDALHIFTPFYGC